MFNLNWTTIDKSSWAPGPWQQEPDKKQWQDAETGLPCLIVRNNGGALCGYVGVGAEHSKYQLDYSGIEVEVHGGLTFSDSCFDMSRENWQKWRVRAIAAKEEAKKFPIGDAAQMLSE